MITLSHEFGVASEMERVWTLLSDLEAVADCFPGAHLESVGGGRFAGGVEVKLGPIGLSYSGEVEFTEVDSGSRRLVVFGQGEDRRGSGTASAEVAVRLAQQEDRVHVSMDSEVELAGKAAQLGGALVQEVSDRLMERFVSCLEEKLRHDSSGVSPHEVGVPERGPASTTAVTMASDEAGARYVGYARGFVYCRADVVCIVAGTALAWAAKRITDKMSA